MRWFSALCIVLAGVALHADPAASADPFDRPAALQPAVDFWKRVYAEVPSDAGLIHDSRHMGVVYERVSMPKNLSRRGRERRVAKVKKRYAAILRKLGSGKRSGLNAEEQRVLALWPAGVGNKALRDGARRLRFQRGLADKFRDGLVRSGRWRGHIQEIFAAHGLPTEFVALPHVESSFNPRAYSKVGAAGLWQFTRSTGRRYMTVGATIDERMDPFIATSAAAKLLKANRETTGSWPLAITAYNHGAAGMRRAKRRLGTSDIAVIVEKYRSRTFGFASRNFYAEFLAALEIDQHPERFFGALEYDPPEQIKTIVLDAYYPAASLEKALGVEEGLLRQLNPSLRSAIWSGQKRVPKSFALRVPPDLGPETATQRLALVPAAERFDRQTRDRYHRVRRGETLSVIARRYGVSQQTLLGLNNLRSRHRIREGQRLRLPDDPADRVPRRQGRSVRVEPAWEGTEYRVRRGETLDAIARRVGSTPQALAAANNLRNANRIYVGQVLQVPGGDPAQAIEAPKAPAAPPQPTPVIVAQTEAEVAEPTPSGEAQAAAEPAAPQPVPAAEPAAPEPVPAAEPEAGESVPAAQPEPAPALADTATESTPTPAPATTALRDAPSGSIVAGDADALLYADPSRWTLEDGRVTVQPDETLGHYADWLEIETQVLRRANGMKRRSDLVVGRRIRLDFSKVPAEEFKRRRIHHHRALRVAYLEKHAIKGTREHVLRRGETLWEISRDRYGIPLWLLRDYNPKVDFSRLQSGARLQIPDVERRAQSSGASSDSSVPASPA